MISQTGSYTRGRFLVDYGREVEEEIARLQELIEKVPELTARYPLSLIHI